MISIILFERMLVNLYYLHLFGMSSYFQ